MGAPGEFQEKGGPRLMAFYEVSASFRGSQEVSMGLKGSLGGLKGVPGDIREFQGGICGLMPLIFLGTAFTSILKIF